MKTVFSYRFVAFLAISFLLAGCSQKKNTFINRSYHNINARYNGYFNANEEYKKGVVKVENGHKENYRKRLPLFIDSNEETAKSVQNEMEVAIKKCSRVIQFHSMDIKGKEYCKWIDDSWMLIGQSYFYEQNWKEAQPIFEYVAKKYKKSDTRYEARMWLVRTLVKQEKYDRADVVLRTLKNNEDKIPEDYMSYYKVVTAEYYLSQDDISRAIINLETATQIEQDKDLRTRWLFVLAQLYAEEGESIRANDAFKQVAKNHPNYEMEFWAQLNRAFSYSSEDGSSYDIKKVLLKMLRDDKNKEYRDKLYYALSKIYHQEGRDDKQITALKLSAKVSVQDDYQKGLSFLTLGRIHFNMPKYKLAQAYYDSTVQYLPEDFPDYDRIVSTQESLKELVAQIIIIEEEDSLQTLAKMPEEELLAFIEEKIEEKKEEEERMKEEAERASQFQASGPKVTFDDGFDKGKWYFYNEKNLSVGMSEFRRIWGSRGNSDNWRRLDQSSESDDGFGDEDLSDSVDTESTEYLVEQYMTDIPRDEKALSASNKRLADAYYTLGNIYREGMNDDERAIGTFRSLVYKMDTSEHHLTTYYILYRMYLNDQRMDSASYFRNIVLYKYPDSDYAKIIQNPDYALEMGKEKKAVAYYYKKALYYYESGYYKACIEKVDQALTKYPDNHLKTKLLYLKALSKGAQGGKDELVSSLKTFSKSNSGTPEAKDADNRIKILTEVRKKVNRAPAPEYTFDRNSRHLAVLMVPTDVADLEMVKRSISNYNTAYHAGKGIAVSNVLFDPKIQMVSIKQFKNLEEAKKYYHAFLSNQTSLKKVNALKLDFFIMSYTNYALFFKDKRIELYEEFMDSNYQL